MFELRFDTDGDAFQEGGTVEITRILRAVAAQLEDESARSRGVYDANGNSVGSWRLSDS